MSRALRTCAVSLAFGLFVGGVADAIDPADLNRITFVNDSGLTIEYLFFAPADSISWGADILGASRRIAPGDRVGFYIYYPAELNAFDLLAVNENGDAYIIWEYEMPREAPVVVRLTEENLESGYDAPAFATVELENATEYDIWFAFFTPADSSVAGIDVLEESRILEAGETLRLRVPVETEPTEYLFQGVDVDRDTYQFTMEISSRRLLYRETIEFDYLVRD